MKKKLKEFIYYSAYTSGFFALWRLLNKNNIIILMLHGVMEEKDDSLWVPLRPQITPTYLAESLVFLKRNYSFISLDSAVNMLNGAEPIQPNSIVLTFDDGYRNNIKYALPILEKLNIPATFFLTTGHIENRIPFWFDRLDYALQQVAPTGTRMVSIAGGLIKIDTTDRSQLRNSYKRLRDFVKAKNMNDLEMVAEFNTLSENLENESGRKLSDIFENDDWSAILTGREITDLNNHPLVTWGSHTVDHFRLNLISNDLAYNQLIQSKKYIEDKTCKPCINFCYPDGGYDENIISLVKKCKYSSSVTVEEGVNNKSTGLYKLKRLPYPLIRLKYESMLFS